jgi:6-carboxyhexanoate--CoA ligase
MRASLGSSHVSGAERIASAGSIDLIVQNLLARARSKVSLPDHITISVETLQDLPVRFLPALDVLTVTVPDVQRGRTAASGTLASLGIAEQTVAKAIALISRGAAPSGHTMRGAIIMDARNGQRLEPDRERGVRASRFDWTDDASVRVSSHLGSLGLAHHRTREALALATKVVHGPGVIAEICWSDDPDYTAGYVASQQQGYVRFPHLKRMGDTKGGRVIFVDTARVQVEELIRYLQVEPALINEIGIFKKELGFEDYVHSLPQY